MVGMSNLTTRQMLALNALLETAKATEDKGFQTKDLTMEAMGHGEASGIRQALAIVLDCEPADVAEALSAA